MNVTNEYLSYPDQRLSLFNLRQKARIAISERIAIEVTKATCMVPAKVTGSPPGSWGKNVALKRTRIPATTRKAGPTFEPFPSFMPR